MITIDARKNFCIASASAGYDASATDIVMATGAGAKFPQIGVGNPGYNLVWWNSTDYANPSLDPEVEIVRVTAHTLNSDEFTIVRAQESTAASVKNMAHKTYSLMMSPTAKMFDDLVTAISEKMDGVTFVDEEILSGSGTNWELAHEVAPGCVPVLKSGGADLRIATSDFTLDVDGRTITTSGGYSAGALIAVYRYVS